VTADPAVVICTYYGEVGKRVNRQSLVFNSWWLLL